MGKALAYPSSRRQKSAHLSFAQKKVRADLWLDESSDFDRKKGFLIARTDAKRSSRNFLFLPDFLWISLSDKERRVHCSVRPNEEIFKGSLFSQQHCDSQKQDPFKQTESEMIQQKERRGPVRSSSLSQLASTLRLERDWVSHLGLLRLRISFRWRMSAYTTTTQTSFSLTNRTREEFSSFKDIKEVPWRSFIITKLQGSSESNKKRWNQWANKSHFGETRDASSIRVEVTGSSFCC